MQFAMIWKGQIDTVLINGVARPGIFRAAIGLTTREIRSGNEIVRDGVHYPAEALTERWSDAERKAIGLLPLETVAQEAFDPLRHDWLDPTFEIQPDRVIEYLTYRDKSAEVVASLQEAAKETRRGMINAEIAALEGGQGRALRETALGRDGALDRLTVLDAAIAAKRAEIAAI
jgi:hypothetical protein